MTTSDQQVLLWINIQFCQRQNLFLSFLTRLLRNDLSEKRIPQTPSFIGSEEFSQLSQRVQERV